MADKIQSPSSWRTLYFEGGNGAEELNLPLLAPLFADLAEYDRQLGQSDTQFARRGFVRAAFAYMEAMTFWLREHTRQWLSSPAVPIFDKRSVHIALLYDKGYRPNKSGKLCEEVNRIPFLNTVAFVLRTSAECWGINADGFFSDSGWEKLQNALEVRHRITHPKQAHELNITDEDENAVREGVRWYINRIIEITNAGVRQMGAGAQQTLIAAGEYRDIDGKRA